MALAKMSSRSLLPYLLRRALELPPQQAFRKAIGMGMRASTAYWHDLRDFAGSTYSQKACGPLHLPFALDPSFPEWTARERADLNACAERYLCHEFDLLGSGWQAAGYASPVRGIEGVRFEAVDEARRVAKGQSPTELVSRSNRRSSRAVFGLIDDPTYRPIDWQCDLRSGHRWSNRTNFRRIAIGVVRGADIKLPWELARLQHLPQLAIAAYASHHGVTELRAPEVYVSQIRNQCLDFIALNPPRHGACWACPMDVGIRAANIVLAHAILDCASLSLDESYHGLVADSIAEHGAHIAATIEWSEVGRSNHFLANIVGLLFCAEALPETSETRGWRDYAASWLLHEILSQFHPDGGNYEGSTSYHRLSAELVTYGLALLGGRLSCDSTYLEYLVTAPSPSIRGGLAPGLREPDLLRRIGSRFVAIRRFLKATIRPDGSLTQIGDTDSGRLFKLSPVLAEAPGSGIGVAARRERPLDATETVCAMTALLGDEARSGDGGVGYAVVKGLASGWQLPAAAPSIAALPECVMLDELLTEMEAFPSLAKRKTGIDLPGFDPGSVTIQYFPHFGLVAVGGSRLCMLVRCAPLPQRRAPTSHLHDDNLCIDIVYDGVPLISDPGTYVYTALPEFRNAYRHVDAHFAPRATTWAAARFTDYLFELDVIAGARCLHASTAGIAVRLESPDGWVQRLLQFLPNELRILDACNPGELQATPEAIACCDGYGIRTTRPSHSF